MADKDFEYNPDIITVTDDDGTEHIFEELDRISPMTTRDTLLFSPFMMMPKKSSKETATS